MQCTFIGLQKGWCHRVWQPTFMKLQDAKSSCPVNFQSTASSKCTLALALAEINMKGSKICDLEIGTAEFYTTISKSYLSWSHSILCTFLLRKVKQLHRACAETARCRHLPYPRHTRIKFLPLPKPLLWRYPDFTPQGSCCKDTMQLG